MPCLGVCRPESTAKLLSNIFEHAEVQATSLASPSFKAEGSVPFDREMSSEEIVVDPHVLAFMRQIEEPSGELARRPIGPERPTPKLRRITRKLSDPAHKTVVPVKPILKSVGTVPGSSTPEHSHSMVKSSIPLKFASRKVPQSKKSSATETLNRSYSSSDSSSDDDLFFTPPEHSDDLWSNGNLPGDSTDNDKLGESKKAGLSKAEQNSGAAVDPSDNFYADPLTPLPTPMLRTSFSQDSPYQGYPLTPRNTIRVKRRPPPIVDELDRQQRNSPFPSRPSFTFEPPLGSPSLSDFPRPPQPPATKNMPSSGAPTAAVAPARKTSWLASFPSLTRRSTEMRSSARPGNVRDASKRKSGDIDGDVEPKRRKVVRLELPSKHKEQHPRLARRPTPYYEPFSAKVKRVIFSLFASFQTDEEEKAQLKAEKLAKKREKMAKKEMEELKESFRHFDDLVD